MSPSGWSLQKSSLISHIELGIVLRVFQGADHNNKHIIGDFFRRVRVFFGSYYQDGLVCTGILTFISEVGLGATAAVFKR